MAPIDIRCGSCGRTVRVELTELDERTACSLCGGPIQATEGAPAIRRAPRASRKVQRSSTAEGAPPAPRRRRKKDQLILPIIGVTLLALVITAAILVGGSSTEGPSGPKPAAGAGETEREKDWDDDDELVESLWARRLERLQRDVDFALQRGQFAEARAVLDRQSDSVRKRPEVAKLRDSIDKHEAVDRRRQAERAAQARRQQALRDQAARRERERERAQTQAAERRNHVRKELAGALPLLEGTRRGEAINRLRALLQHAADADTVQQINVAIDACKQRFKDDLAAQLRPLGSFLRMRRNAFVATKLQALLADPRWLPLYPFIEGCVAEVGREGAEIALSSWLEALGRHALRFSEERPLPAGARCRACSGRRFGPCGACERGHVDGECGACSGRGQRTCRTCRGSGSVPCSRCKQTGRVTVWRERQVDCPRCTSRSKLCNNCGNTRRIKQKYSVETSCPDCRGDRTARCTRCRDGQQPCPDCGGAGRGKRPHRDCGGLDRRYCATCRGTGIATDWPALPVPEARPDPGPDPQRPPDDDPPPPAHGDAVVGPAFRARLSRRGGTASTERAVDQGLAWLAAHQSATGGWEGRAFGRGCRCDGAAKMTWVDDGLTGLAVLAFLGAGQTPQRGKHAAVVSGGVRHLIGRQTAQGRIGPAREHYMYSHAIATLALVEAYAMTGSAPYGSSARRALTYLIEAQNPGLAWRYHARSGDNDISVTGWAVQALHAARKAGLVVPGIEVAMRSAASFVERVTDDTNHVSGYTKRPPRGWKGPTSSRFQAPELGVDTSGSHRANPTPTAVAAMCRVLWGRDRRDPSTRGALEILDGDRPVWDTGGGGKLSRVDCYYWYYGTLALGLARGPTWSTWNRAVGQALLPHQHRFGHATGSWDPVGAWGFAGGRVYTTAINILTLEVHYRAVR